MTTPLLTTVTPYWGRPEALLSFLTHLVRAQHARVVHLIYFIGENPPSWFEDVIGDAAIGAVCIDERPGKSIGHWHNEGFKLADTQWVMKLDCDAVPHTTYFNALIPLLEPSQARTWFNGGMMYLNQHYSKVYLGHNSKALEAKEVLFIVKNPHTFIYPQSSYFLPQASNFICRRDEYLKLGGCDVRFQGWGWEDYQQLYMLEHALLGRCPLPSPITLQNVTQRCRDTIGRKKARDLILLEPSLCLLHRWHAQPPIVDAYKVNEHKNRQVLFDYVTRKRSGR